MINNSKFRGRKKRMGNKIGDEFINDVFKNITINIPTVFNEMLLLLVELGRFPSRSEAIRWAIHESIGENQVFYKTIKKECNKEYNKLEIITVNMSEKEVAEMEKLAAGFCTSRSEFARLSIKKFIENNLNYINNPDTMNEEEKEKEEPPKFTVIKILDDYNGPKPCNGVIKNDSKK